MAASAAPDAPIADRSELVAWIEAGCKPEAAWRIGTEHEKIGYRLSDLAPLAYDGESGIRAIFERLAGLGWQPVYEGDNPVALSRGRQSITLEPGGQLELSGAPLETVHQTCDEVNGHLEQLRPLGEELGIGFLGIGMQPKWRRDDIPVMPKGRYDIMRAYMPRKGALGLDMMLRTCTVQTNLDFDSEADMVRKFRVGLALQPVAVALFANSPFVDGKPNGYLSYRTHIWSDTDPDRCGVPAFVFDDGMGFEAYADYALDVPMYFVHRGGRYVDVAGRSFRDFLDGRLPELPGERPTLADWENHLSTIFTDVRLKRYLEMRGADGGPWRMLCALPAFWVGLLYDRTALGEAEALVSDWGHADVVRLRDAAARHGFEAEHGSRTLRDIARDALAIARGGLRRRARLDRGGGDETGFLTQLDTAVAQGLCPARTLLRAWRGEWGGSVDPVFETCAY